ncbi:Aste57867_9529 [Aphanomyces stellatus]|uniref:Aste57867_9529 protein n=1 Tax=Aphanomyces stellatus TaxID=120398 RepID=A0A485KNE5_9STRA|nr:hypothetical protein As57867_009492 [Aphanomyces stellatus]VFT86408.1 Aste57867_9529 [Aphanomyces stellatus]
MAVDWKRRILTFVVAAPVAIYLLCDSLGSSVLATAILAGCLIEFRLNICPQVLLHIAAQKPDAKNHVVHAAFLVLLGCLVSASATQSKSLHDATTSGAYFVVFGFHLLRAAFAASPSPKALHPGLLDILLDLFALGYIVQYDDAISSPSSPHHHAHSGFSHAVLLRESTSYGTGLQILTLSCSWIADTGALVAGSLVGTTKLLPSVSPGKTTAGACGSVAFGVLTVVGAQAITSVAARGALPPMDVAEQIVLGSIMGTMCVMGDLVESYMKRVAQVKDSGALFPGHGGCLDRMDSLLFVAPFMYYVVQVKQWV